MTRRILTAREQLQMLSPWREHEITPTRHHEAFLKVARYPQEWRGDAPYGRLPSGRARNRPPSVRRDPEDINSEIIDPSEIRYENRGEKVVAYHPNGESLGHYSWEGSDYGDVPHITVAQVNPAYQGQGVSGAIIDHIRENYEPDLAHSGYQGEGSLSYQGRAGALRDLGNTEEEHNDYFNTKPYNYGDPHPVSFDRNFVVTDEQRRAHKELMHQYEEDRRHPNYTGTTSSGFGGDPDLVDEYGDRHEYGYDSDGDYVGLSSGGKNEDGYSEEGYDSEGYDSEGYDRDGYDRDERDEFGFHRDTGLNREGETRHGYTPGDGTPPENTVPMSQMTHHWEQHGLPVPSQEHLEMMEDAADIGAAPTMYAVRRLGEVSPHDSSHHIGNGDTVYSSLERARQVAYHPDYPIQDKNIVKVEDLDPDHLHTDASGKTPEDFHYAPPSEEYDAEDTASTEASLVHDPYRHERILGELGHGWSRSTESPLRENSGFEYTNPDTGRTGRMYQASDGTWRAQHQPQFGRQRTTYHDTYRDAVDTVREGTRPGPTMDQHALEVNNHYGASGGGEVEWEPHPSGQGLMARTPHGDLHLTQDPDTGRWNWHAGPHGSQPGDEGNMRAMLSDRSLTDTAKSGIGAITRSPFHGGLRDELGEGWRPHPTSPMVFTQPLPSGNHAFVRKNDDGTYNSGIQRDNGRGQPYAAPIAIRDSDDLVQAKAFVHHRENPVPASGLGKGWQDEPIGPRSFPSYLHEGHPSGASANVGWSHQGGWKPTVVHDSEVHHGKSYKTPQEAASWASSLMDNLGNK